MSFWKFPSKKSWKLRLKNIWTNFCWVVCWRQGINGKIEVRVIGISRFLLELPKAGIMRGYGEKFPDFNVNNWNRELEINFEICARLRVNYSSGSKFSLEKTQIFFSILKPFLQFNIGRYTRFFRSIVVPWVTYAHRSNNLIFANICLSSSSSKSKRIAIKVIPISLTMNDFYSFYYSYVDANKKLRVKVDQWSFTDKISSEACNILLGNC